MTLSLNLSKLYHFVENKSAHIEVQPDEDTLVKVEWTKDGDLPSTSIYLTNECVIKEDPNNSDDIIIRTLVNDTIAVLKETIMDNVQLFKDDTPVKKQSTMEPIALTCAINPNESCYMHITPSMSDNTEPLIEVLNDHSIVYHEDDILTPMLKNTLEQFLPEYIEFASNNPDMFNEEMDVEIELTPKNNSSEDAVSYQNHSESSLLDISLFTTWTGNHHLFYSVEDENYPGTAITVCGNQNGSYAPIVVLNKNGTIERYLSKDTPNEFTEYTDIIASRLLLVILMNEDYFGEDRVQRISANLCRNAGSENPEDVDIEALAEKAMELGYYGIFTADSEKVIQIGDSIKPLLTLTDKGEIISDFDTSSKNHTTHKQLLTKQLISTVIHNASYFSSDIVEGILTIIRDINTSDDNENGAMETDTTKFNSDLFNTLDTDELQQFCESNVLEIGTTSDKTLHVRAFDRSDSRMELATVSKNGVVTLYMENVLSCMEDMMSKLVIELERTVRNNPDYFKLSLNKEAKDIVTYTILG